MTTLGFGTCNLYNLQLPGERIYHGRGWTPEAYEAKVKWLAWQLERNPVDVWGFQEMWTREALTDVIVAAGLESEYTLLTPPGHAGSGIVCAGAVRNELLVTGSEEWMVDFPDDFLLRSEGDDPQAPQISVSLRGFSRPVLRFTIDVKPSWPKIRVYVAHLKSKRPTTVYNDDWYRGHADTYKPHGANLGAAISTIRRTAEASALRWILTQDDRAAQQPLVVLGDLNDGQHSNTLNILTQQPRYVLSRLGGSGTALYSAGAMQQFRSQRDVYYTHMYKDAKESLDHILVSEEFFEGSKKRYWRFGGLTILNDHLEEDHKASGSTDHGIVVARFRR